MATTATDKSQEKNLEAGELQQLQPPAPALTIPKISFEGGDGVPISQVPTPKDEYDPTSHPASPFYSHPTTQTSFEQLRTTSTLGLNHYESDLESGIKRSSDENPKQRGAVKDCTVWPQRKTLLQQAKLKKRQRACYPWNTLNKKQRLIAKLVILVVIIAIGVGIGVGVSRAVGGTWYKSANQQGTVGAPQ